MSDVVHETAGVYLFARHGSVWRMCVIECPGLGGELSLCGGHVEDGEAPAAAALREVSQETGHRVRLLPRPLQDGYPHPAAAAAWHVASVPAAADSRCPRPHIHRDHIFVGVVDRPFATFCAPEYVTHWVGRDEFGRLNLPKDTPVLGSSMFEAIDRAASPQPQPSPDEDLRAELLRRQEVDQAVRLVPTAKHTPELHRRRRTVDEANTDWLHATIRSHGWPGEALVGRDGASAAWLLAQHADHRPDFQRECLDLLAGAVTAGDADPRHGALLEDRVLLAQGLPQVFGTQLIQGPDGTLTPHPLRDPANVESRRAAWGLDPLETYVHQVRENIGR
ncbi:NUDIX hydrolase [Streptomyces sp. NPDC001553]|uniref:NUDIX hydrolase n=1 Tax=Streptomyces sp. NPDC001553 TaxID=3154385 RepID=UPI00331BF609